MSGGVLSESGAGAPSAPGGFRVSNDGNTVGHCISSRMPDAASAPANSTPAEHDTADHLVCVAAHNVVPSAGDFWASLTKSEDVLVWNLRGAGHGWEVIADLIQAERAHRERQRRAVLRRWAKHHRAVYRTERGLA